MQWNATGTATTVDYEGFRRDASALDDYLKSLASVNEARFRQFGKAEREAFLNNAYNAATVQLILTRPGVASIKDLGGLVTTPWQKRFVNLLGRTRTLDEIEHDMLRGAPDYNDPRVHLAVNCASVGCPALRPEAYVGSRLREQLEDRTRRCLGDRTRNRYDERSGVLWVSRIFDWYGGAIFATESGDACDDVINRIVPGGNYGWRPNYPCEDAWPTGPAPAYNTNPPLKMPDYILPVSAFKPGCSRWGLSR